MAVPGEGSAPGDPSFTFPPGLLLQCKEPSLWGGGGQRSWLLGFQFWPQVARRGNPKISAHKECHATAPKKEELLGFPKEGDVRSEMSRNHSGNRKCGQKETCACKRGGGGRWLFLSRGDRSACPHRAETLTHRQPDGALESMG